MSPTKISPRNPLPPCNSRTECWSHLVPPPSRRYTQAIASSRKHSVSKALVFGLCFGFSQFSMMGAFALAFWYGGVLQRAGDISMPHVLRCIFAVLTGAIGVGEVFALAGDQGEGSKAAERVYRLLDAPRGIDCTGASGLPLELVTGRAALEEVTFRYPARPEACVLQRLQLGFAAGQKVALLGATGCGKSTIISLLLRYYDPLTGRVLVEGCAAVPGYDAVRDARAAQLHELQRVNLRRWRGHCGVVSQEPVLFDDTLAANIRYGKPDATDAEVRDAARKANIHDYVCSLPQGYDTRVGPRGSQLSGGQKQRIAIARCIIRKPAVLLLDEATSALDSRSEREVQVAPDSALRLMAALQSTAAHHPP